jgi:cardiolipin synthase
MGRVRTVISWILGLGLPLLYLLGVLSAIDAVMKARTAQGAIAWAVSHVTVPFLSLPLYWVFGRSSFDDYVQVLQELDAELDHRLEEAKAGPLREWLVDPDEESDPRRRAELKGFDRLSTLFFTRGNGARLFVDGRQAFDAMFACIDEAQDYVLAQFYIVRDDDLGREFQGRLIAAAERGVRVYLLFDEFGSHALPRRYVRQLHEAGIRVQGATGGRRWLGRFRLNFRNHRKIVVADGRRGFLGGLNVGDEYVGGHPRLTPWRDTQIRLDGPVVQGLQLSFIRDWYYVSRRVPELTWDVVPSTEDRNALVLASGPADPIETCGLLFAHAIDSAERRVWIASPYFVPDGRVLGALQLAALRGVDVRILIPGMADHWMFRYVHYAFLPEVQQVGVRVFRYGEGFMHQKVILVDDDYAGVGTANLDNRSFRLNFELTCLIEDHSFCADVAEMLERDFGRSTLAERSVLGEYPFALRLATEVTRLLSPTL